MTTNMLDQFGSRYARLQQAFHDLREGKGVLLLDDEDRENEADIIFSAETIDLQGMALLIRECSGIICLCLEEEKTRALKLPQMVEDNSSQYGTGFTVSIEAAKGVTTGVSAQDRLTTIRAAIAATATPADLSRPGHVFPLRAREGGVLTRKGHTEGTVDLMKLAGLGPHGVLCELMNEDGTMARGEQVVAFAHKHHMTLLSIQDIVDYRLDTEEPLRVAV